MMSQKRKNFLDNINPEDVIEMSMILDRVDKFGLRVEVMHDAIKEIKSNPNITPLLALQIAAKDWDC